MATLEHIATPVTPEERAIVGRAARSILPRSALGEWTPAADRPDPVDLLEEQAQTRVPELVPIRYGRMLLSPFTFFRGAAYPMAADLAQEPRSGLNVQLCGDAHLSNFGAFAAPDRRMVFSVNDFDETLPGPFEWDVKRLVASFEVAARDRGFPLAVREAILREAGRSYRTTMAELAEMRTFDVWYGRIELDELIDRVDRLGTAKQAKRFERNVAKARAKDSLRAFGKLTETVDGQLRIVSDPPLIVRVGELADLTERAELEKFLKTIMRSYRRSLPADRRPVLERFHYVDAARKVVGVGSVGTRAFIMLMLGRDHGDPLFLQFKEAQASVLEPFLGKSAHANHGQRVVEGQRLMQAASDVMLGWLRATGIDGERRDFYVRQLWDQKGSAIVELMEPQAMTVYATLCGRTLARAHARSGDPIAISAYLGRSDRFDKAMARYARAYADQNERDHQALQEAVDSGRVEAVPGL